MALIEHLRGSEYHECRKLIMGLEDKMHGGHLHCD